MFSEQRTKPLLKDLLRERGLSQREVAQALSRPEATINKWVNGSKPNPGNQAQVVVFLNVLGDAMGLPPVTENEIWGK